jgi:hypothetical protein
MGIIVVVFIVFFMVLIAHGSQRNREMLETITETDRGTGAERNLILELLDFGIPAEIIFHDLYVKKYNGNFSQIDLIVVADTGIIVFEVKDYSGWIFGNGRQTKWTKVLAYGKRKYNFYNPIMQNNKHIIDLRKQLKLSEKIPFYSIVVFYGDCELKDINFIPNGTFITKSSRVLDVLSGIINNNETANYADKNKILKTLKEYAKNGANVETQDQHIENIKDMLGEHRVFK